MILWKNKFHKLEGNLISNGAILIWEFRQEKEGKDSQNRNGLVGNDRDCTLTFYSFSSGKLFSNFSIA